MLNQFSPAMLTLDVEDWYHANFTQLEDRWSSIRQTARERAYAMDRNTDHWIQLLAQYGAHSTCFVLGEFAEKYPEAVRRLAKAGHEIASHGQSHDLIYRMTREQFREFLKNGIGVLGNLLGKAPIGFRAPSWSVDARTPWYTEELLNQGIRYDSSQFPVRTPLFGQPGASIHVHREGELLRVPVTVLVFGQARFPFASGAFFRLAPLPVIRMGLRRAVSNRQPVMVVLHPRELDPDHPRLPLRGWEGWVHYQNLGTVELKLRRILPEYHWRSIAETQRSLLDMSSGDSENGN